MKRLGEQPTQISPGVCWGGDLKRAISNSVLDNAIRCNQCNRIFCVRCIQSTGGICPVCRSNSFEKLWAGESSRSTSVIPSRPLIITDSTQGACYCKVCGEILEDPLELQKNLCTNHFSSDSAHTTDEKGVVCTSCGKQTKPGANFCGRCGTKL